MKLEIGHNLALIVFFNNHAHNDDLLAHSHPINAKKVDFWAKKWVFGLKKCNSKMAPF